MGEAKLRAAFKRQHLDSEIRHARALVLEEFGILNGYVRVDVAVIDCLIHGFELKSNTDTLYRLPRQVAAYSRVLDRASLVTAPCHLRQCISLLPSWWGIVLVTEQPSGVLSRVIRPAKQNPSQNPLDIARLLWRNEVLEILEKLGLAKGVRSKPRATLQARLADTLELEILRFTVRHYLRKRQHRRSDVQQR